MKKFARCNHKSTTGMRRTGALHGLDKLAKVMSPWVKTTTVSAIHNHLHQILVIFYTCIRWSTHADPKNLIERYEDKLAISCWKTRALMFTFYL